MHDVPDTSSTISWSTRPGRPHIARTSMPSSRPAFTRWTRNGLVPCPPRRRRRAILIEAALVGLAIAVPAVILSGSSSAPSPTDLQQITAVIDRWQAVDFLPWPSEHYGASDSAGGAREDEGRPGCRS